MITTRKHIMALLMLCTLVFSGSTSAVVRQPNYCNLYGSVYIEENPKYADFRVFVEETEGSANLWIYATDDKLFADRPGLWHFTTKRDFADFIIYIDDHKYLADFSIYYIDVESFAGCND